MKLDPRLLRLVKNSPFALALTLSLGFAGGFLAVGQARVLSHALQGVFLEGRSLAQMVGTLEVMLVLICLRAICAWGLETAAHSLADRVKAGLRRQLYAHLVSLGPAGIGALGSGDSEATTPGTLDQGVRTGEFVNVAVEGIEALDSYFSQYLPQLALAALLPLTYLALILPLDPISAAILLVTAPLIPVFMILIGKAAEALTNKQWESLSRMSAYFLDVLQGLTTLKILGQSRAQVENIASVSEQHRRATLSVLKVAFLSALVLEWAATLSTAVIAVEVGLRLLYGRLPFEEAFFILVLAPEFYLPLRLLGTRFHSGMAGAAAGKRIFDILERELPVTLEKGSHAAMPGDFAETPATGGPQVVEFRNVSFTYPGEREALKEVSFEIQPGERVALVGPSGAGKSTIANLLLGFLEPDSGEVYVGRRSLQEISPDTWRENLTWVPQNPYLFHDSVEENIRLARPEAATEDIEYAARLAHAHEFIQELPDGYQTIIGERGARLSGGQAQRIALARAFLKNSSFLIMDEATSNLDPETEASICESMESLLAGRTALIIAHRLATVATADRIIVLDQGQICESGTHAELMARGGLYRTLVKASQDGRRSPRRQITRTGLGAVRESTLLGWKKPASPVLIMEPPLIEPSLGPSDYFASPDSLGRSAHLSSTLMRMLQLVWPFRWRILLAALLGFATVASGVGLMATSAYIIAAAALHPSIAVLQVAIVGVRFFGLARGLFRYLERYVSHSVTFQVLARLRVWFYQALEPLAPSRLMSYRGGDLLSRLIGDIASLENFYVRALAPPLVAVLAMVGITLFLSAYNPILAAGLAPFWLAGGVALPLGMRFLGRKAGRQSHQARAKLSVTLVDGIQGLADLVAFGQESRQMGAVEAAGRELAAAQKAMAQLGGLQTALGGLLANLGMWAVLCLGISLVSGSAGDGGFSGVDLAVVVLAVLASFEAVLPLPQAAQYLESNLEAARRLFELVDVRPEVTDPVAPLVVPDRLSIEVQGLTYRYPGHSATLPVLEDISFRLQPGKNLAVVGPSGSGKTTLAHLLVRFWEYSRTGNTGEILLNGRELRSYQAEDVRSRIALVSQNTYIFNATLRDNLLIALKTASETEIQRAVDRAQLSGLIQGLPQGYDTWVGEGGARLSAGERQRIAIARALLRADSQTLGLLILDEATANLDPATEWQALVRIYELMKGRSILNITHRLVAMEWADEVLVLDRGRVVERGLHQDLVELGGLYSKMWKQQNLEGSFSVPLVIRKG